MTLGNRQDRKPLFVSNTTTSRRFTTIRRSYSIDHIILYRWDGGREWDDQYTNYQKIMDYVNADPSLNAEISWGTLTDYFHAGK